MSLEEVPKDEALNQAEDHNKDVKIEVGSTIEEGVVTPTDMNESLSGKRVKSEEAPDYTNSILNMPSTEVVGGSSIRQYLNRNLTAPLLEGLQEVARQKPNDPLRWLGEFLIKKSGQSTESN